MNLLLSRASTRLHRLAAHTGAALVLFIHALASSCITRLPEAA